jgi:hypothetical protein
MEYDALYRELQETKHKLAESNRRFDDAVKTIHLQGQIIKSIKDDGEDDLTFLADINTYVPSARTDK